VAIYGQGFRRVAFDHADSRPSVVNDGADETNLHNIIYTMPMLGYADSQRLFAYSNSTTVTQMTPNIALHA